MANAAHFLSTRSYLEVELDLEDPMFIGARRRVRVICFLANNQLDFQAINTALYLLEAYNRILGCGVCQNSL